ncbi:MAG: hypothetical protein NT116_01605 [Candidatus Parcubacteria bacterium]|nr:hypothetical protein [Candidatus Parcubacteria bacterium]
MTNLTKIKFRYQSLLVLMTLGLILLANTPQALAQTGNDLENLTAFRLVREFSIFVNIVLIILVILLAVSLHGALKYLGSHDTPKNKLKLISSFLLQEPAEIFSQLSAKDQHGTYQLPFEKYRQLHLISRKTFLRTLGLIILQVILIVFMIYGLTLLTHYTKAQENNLLQSHNFQLQLDK